MKPFKDSSEEKMWRTLCFLSGALSVLHLNSRPQLDEKCEELRKKVDTVLEEVNEDIVHMRADRDFTTHSIILDEHS